MHPLFTTIPRSAAGTYEILRQDALVRRSHGSVAVMTDRIAQFGGNGVEPAENPSLTLVDLIWREKRVEHWLRFGRPSSEQRIDSQRRTIGFVPGSIFALVRWAGNDYGTVASRLDILRAVWPGESFQTLPCVRPGAEILLRVSGWPKVERVLQAVDAIEALGIDPCLVSPEHWRHVHNRMIAGEPFRTYTRAQHAAWLKRRKVSLGRQQRLDAPEARPEGRRT